MPASASRAIGPPWNAHSHSFVASPNFSAVDLTPIRMSSSLSWWA